ncbi:MAG: inositol monophosphatase family protein [Oscillospiraceae bacterium]|nr:inositol monophosphatase family protein [Oscillospiraceae bacterium]MDD4367413.1 inositol monophosphatase family protein [Oscillospiraceae bacterium]
MQEESLSCLPSQGQRILLPEEARTDWLALLDKIQAAVRQASRLMLDASDIRSKTRQKTSRADLVTTYDVAIQKELQMMLNRLCPDLGFLGEEGEHGTLVNRDSFFVVDPIDGTTNFVYDYRHSAISVGLILAGEPVLACCFDPYLDECFTALKGLGAKLNGVPMQVGRQELGGSVILFGTSPYNPETRPKSYRYLQALHEHGRDVRRSGSAVLDLAYVAAGRGDLFFESHLSPWDFGAAALLVKEAGGKVTRLDGQPLRYDRGGSVLAGNPTVWQQAQTIWAGLD